MRSHLSLLEEAAFALSEGDLRVPQSGEPTGTRLAATDENRNPLFPKLADMSLAFFIPPSLPLTQCRMGAYVLLWGGAATLGVPCAGGAPDAS